MTIQGKSVYSGVAIGRLAIYRKSENQVKREKIADTAKEVKRFEDAKDTAKQQLAGLYDKALKEVGEVNAAIFEVHQMMLNDLDYIESITNMIEGQQVNAEYAVATTGDTFSEMFAAMDDDYMRERAADVRDVSNRVVSILQGNGGNGLNADELGHVLHVGLAARKARNARAGERHLARGSELENHVGVAVLLALAQNILERDELAVELVDAVGVVPHQQEVRRGRLHLCDALDGLVGVDDAVGVRVLRHVPHALDARVLDEVFDNVHVGAVFGHRDGDELKAEALGHLEVAVIARRGAEPFDALFLAPRLFAVQ